MGSYYYLLSSLPSLRFEDASPYDKEGFLALCKDQLNKGEYQDLEAFFSQKPVGGPYGAYVDFCNQINSLINRERKLVNPKFGDPGKEDFNCDKALAAKAKALVAKTYAVLNSSEGDPLASQLELLKLKWNKAEQMDNLHNLDSVCFAVYAIKLSLLWQKQSFDPVVGSMEFKKLFSNIQSEIKSV